MQYHRSQLVRGHVPAETESFDEVLYDQVRNAPWVGASLVFHAAVFGFLLLLPQDVELPEKPTVLVADMTAAVPDLDEPDEPPPEQPDIDKPPDVPDDVKLPDLPPAEETDRESDEDDVPDGFETAVSDAPFDFVGQNALIGIGANAGNRWGERGKGGKQDGSGGGGPGGGMQPVVDRALSWLSNHQSPEGHWDCDGFSDHCKGNKCGGPGNAVHDTGVTGLALLAFLAQGETHKKGRFQDTVRRGLRYLTSVQDAEGCIGPQTAQGFQYSHAIATMALAEAYGMTESPLLREPAQRAVNFVHKSQNPYSAWRYGVRDGDNDTSVTGWMIMALKSAKIAGLQVDDGSFRSALAWVDKMTEPEFGRVGYQRRGGPPARTQELAERFPSEQSEALTSVGVLTRIFCGQDPKTNEMIQKGADLMLTKAPRWDVDAGTLDMYHWYYGTLAMHQIGGDRWKQWNRAMKTAIVDHQRKESGRDEDGSWDPLGPWGDEGGRVYSTALMTLCLQVYYRYERVF